MKPQGKYNHLKKKYAGSLTGFKTYLEKKGYHETTIEKFINYAAYFFYWKESRKYNQVQYGDLLTFIGHCRDEGDSAMLTNRKLSAIRKYYHYLQLSDPAIKNPAGGLYLKGRKTGIPRNLLEKEELRQLYEGYHAYDLRTARNKVILGLLVNQALTTGELNRLEPEHINLKTGTIEIPGSTHSNARTLNLESFQILGLQEYITQIRPAVLKAIREKPPWPGRKAQNPDITILSRRLFISLNGAGCIKKTLMHLTGNLKLLNAKVKNIKQIRQSVIAAWLKNEDVRTVQYKAGHRYVSTTERYQATNLDDLQEALNEHHPLNSEAPA